MPLAHLSPSPRVRSPRVRSQRVRSQRVRSQRVRSQRVYSPRVYSPRDRSHARRVSARPLVFASTFVHIHIRRLQILPLPPGFLLCLSVPGLLPSGPDLLPSRAGRRPSQPANRSAVPQCCVHRRSPPNGRSRYSNIQKIPSSPHLLTLSAVQQPLPPRPQAKSRYRKTRHPSAAHFPASRARSMRIYFNIPPAGSVSSTQPEIRRIQDIPGFKIPHPLRILAFALRHSAPEGHTPRLDIIFTTSAQALRRTLVMLPV